VSSGKGKEKRRYKFRKQNFKEKKFQISTLKLQTKDHEKTNNYRNADNDRWWTYLELKVKI